MQVNVIGKNREKHFVDLMVSKGAWVLNIPSTFAGQPFDIIAVKDEDIYFIDVKNCESDIFYFRNIQPNQTTAMELLDRKSTNKGIKIGFAIHFNDIDDYMFLSYENYKIMMQKGEIAIKLKDKRLDVFT